MTFQLGAALAVFLAGSTPGGTVPATPANQQISIPVIEPVALKTMMHSGSRYMIVDIRQPSDYAANHIEGAVLLPFDTLAASYSRLPKNVPLVIYCGDGVTSAKAVSFLLARGYRRAMSLQGGFRAWAALA